MTALLRGSSPRGPGTSSGHHLSGQDQQDAGYDGESEAEGGVVAGARRALPASLVLLAWMVLVGIMDMDDGGETRRRVARRCAQDTAMPYCRLHTGQRTADSGRAPGKPRSCRKCEKSGAIGRARGVVVAASSCRRSRCRCREGHVGSHAPGLLPGLHAALHPTHSAALAEVCVQQWNSGTVEPAGGSRETAGDCGRLRAVAASLFVVARAAHGRHGEQPSPVEPAPPAARPLLASGGLCCCRRPDPGAAALLYRFRLCSLAAASASTGVFVQLRSRLTG